MLLKIFDISNTIYGFTPDGYANANILEPGIRMLDSGK